MFGAIKTDRKFEKFICWCRNVSIVADVLSYTEYVKKFGDYIVVEDHETISYVPKHKVPICDGFNDSKFRTKIKIGKLVSKAISEKWIGVFNIKISDIEKFVNLFKSYFDTDINDFKVVVGEEILTWYLDRNYHAPANRQMGSLWNSCMRYSDRNKFMELYAKNPNSVKMLIHLDKEGKLRSRALLWENCVDENGDVYKFMDRIYSVYDHEVSSFKNWATENGYIYKYEQSSKSISTFVHDDKVKYMNLCVHLENYKFKYYPYIDTLKFFDIDSGHLRNYDDGTMDYILVQSNGGVKPERQEEVLEYDEDEV